MELSRTDLHACVSDPLLHTMSFLNEIMDRFPQALSFAPGAPYAGFFDDFEVAGYIERYTNWLQTHKGMRPEAVRKHLYQYGPSRGQINELLAAALSADEGIEVDPRAIVVTAGCQEAMLLVLRALCRGAGDVVAVANPCFVGIAGAARLLDIPIVPVDETAHGLDLDQLGDVCARARAEGRRIRALYVAPDYSNPSGSQLGEAARLRLLDLAEREDFLIMEDNAYGFTASEAERVPTLKALDRCQRVVYLGTCAKICLPGVRVGFVVADQVVDRTGGTPHLLSDELAQIKSMVTVNTSPICQAIVGGMLLAHGGSLAAIGRDKAAFYRSNLERLLQALERHIGSDPELAACVHWNRPRGGFFVRMSLPVECDNSLLEVAAGTYGVLWTPMRYFCLNRSGDYQLRLSCSYLTGEQIEEGVRRLAAFLRDSRVLPHPAQSAEVTG
jgi:(S)-3,5-dihydroxyphenylglycine transaminase